MRLLFSTNNHMNTDISDERGYIYYTISTPPGSKRVTTITKYNWSGSNGVPETMGVIEWHWWKDTVFHYNGQVTPANSVLQQHAQSRHFSGWHFVASDEKIYRWKLESTHCWMKPAESDIKLVRFHRKNLGFQKPAHPAYLDISPEVAPIVDHVILTFVYIESLRQEEKEEQARRGRNS